MGKKANKTVSYIRISDSLAQKLDRRIKRLGYTSRSEFFTAAAYAALGKTDSANDTPLPDSLKTWIEGKIPKETEEQIREHLLRIISDTLIPVIAIKGIDIAFENTWEDIRELCHEQTGIWTTKSELREAYEAFAATHKTELTRYRKEQLERKIAD